MGYMIDKFPEEILHKLLKGPDIFLAFKYNTGRKNNFPLSFLILGKDHLL